MANLANDITPFPFGDVITILYVTQASAITEYIPRPKLSSNRQINCIKIEDKGTTLHNNYNAQ